MCFVKLKRNTHSSKLPNRGAKTMILLKEKQSSPPTAHLIHATKFALISSFSYAGIITFIRVQIV